jgi:hypothetical protein
MEATNINELRLAWRALFNQDPPFRPRQDFMQGHIAWAIQAKEHGGLKRKTSNQLKQLMDELRKGEEFKPEQTLTIKPGTKLIRQYQGKRHEVIVVEDGFRYEGESYNSLSSVAREITGTRWNGRVFFGVKKL